VLLIALARAAATATAAAAAATDTDGERKDVKRSQTTAQSGGALTSALIAELLTCGTPRVRCNAVMFQFHIPAKLRFCVRVGLFTCRHVFDHNKLKWFGQISVKVFCMRKTSVTCALI